MNRAQAARLGLSVVAALLLAAPTPGDVGGCADPASPPEDASQFCRARVFHECTYMQRCGTLNPPDRDCGLYASTCGACRDVALTCCQPVTVRMALGCFDAMDARTCDAPDDPVACTYFCRSCEMPPAVPVCP